MSKRNKGQTPVKTLTLEWDQSTEDMLTADLPSGNVLNLYHGSGGPREINVSDPTNVRPA